MIRKPPAPPSTNRIGIDVTRAPIGKARYTQARGHDLANELMTHDDVAVGVVQRAASRVIDGKFGVVHEMDVGGADRCAERLQQKITLPGNGIGGLTNGQPALT